ncbi:hypothetical protein AA0Z99_12760 [Agrococcus sp. 1P02AA]|uniref:hypothetical protein n=1 Tax=Agrococcus sp. 1P02AA TaxID=3132259 RepID=UPI0039A48541
MRSFASSVVELRQRFESDVQTHPFECGWADEAIFFVSLHDPAPGTVLDLRVQLSPDGIRWHEEGSTLRVERDGYVRVTHFGGFLRLAGSASDRGGATPVTISVRLALKG